MKIKILLISMLLPLLFIGCDDLFDKGEVEKTYDGPDVVEFFPLQQEVDLAEDATATIAVQLIGAQRTSDLSVSYSVDSGNSTAEAGTHYNITTPSPVTITSGSSSVDIEVDLIDGSLVDGEEVTLTLILEGGDGVEASANLDTSVLFITYNEPEE